MALFGKFGSIIQKALFSTSLGDIVEAIDGLRVRVEELNKKLDKEVNVLREQLEELERKQAAGKKNPPN